MRYEVLTAVLAFHTVQRDVTLCSSVVWYQNFGGKYFFLQNAVPCVPNYTMSHPKRL